MIQTNCNPNLTSIASANNYAQLQQLNATNLMLLSENNQKYSQFDPNQLHMYNYSPNYLTSPAPFTGSQFYQTKNLPQSTYVQPIYYPSYNFYPYANSLNYNNYPNYYQVQQNLSQAHSSNTSNQYEMNSNSKSLVDEQSSLINNFNSNNNQFYNFSPPPQTALNEPKIDNRSNFYGYNSSNAYNLPFDDDSFGSIFQPSSLIHPTQFKKQKIEQYQKDDNIEKQKSQQVKEFEPAHKETALNESKNVSNELNDSQKVFKPKTFREIEEEEKKYQKNARNVKRNGSQSYKRSTKNW